ncbi:MAG: Gfo/Idh/MocA family oxidoreductase [Patescibacteria group bacterium]|jgi:UDP-N-acetylglucosamine 3-dehydrogenase
MKKKGYSKKVNVAVIGVGNMGKHHARNYFELPEANLVAVCDIDKEVGLRIAKQFKCNFYTDYLQMFKHEKIEAVSIVVPTLSHYKVASQVMSKVKNILLEKPITSRTNQAKRLIAMAKKNHNFFTIGHIERFNPAVRKVKEIIKSGSIGTVTSITSKRVGPAARQIKNSNVLIDLAVHDIDIFNYLLEKKPNYVNANGGKAIHPNIFDYSEIFLKYGAISGYIQVNWITPVRIRELDVTGTEGYIKVNYITQEINMYKSKYKKEYTNHGDFIIKFGFTKKRTIPVSYAEPLRSELKSFLKQSTNNLKPEVTPEDGYIALSIALQAEHAIQNNGKK